MRGSWKKTRALILVVLLVLWALLGISAAADQIKLQSLKVEQEFGLMRPDKATFLEWVRAHERAPNRPPAPIRDRILEGPGASKSLLSLLEYTPSERNQASCGNCWAWAGTGALAIAMNLQESVKDRLSVQFISSCNTAMSCCDGGWLEDFSDFYTGKGYTIPWSNTNAEWQHGSGACTVDCADISTSPQYGITSISRQQVTTHSVGQAQAVANIKAAIDNNEPVWFAFFMPKGSDWTAFQAWWFNQDETAIWDFDPYSARTKDSGFAGHAVLIVGYDDSAATPYWVALNSWGDDSGDRPNGTFRVKMNMNYDNYYIDGGNYNALYFETLSATFAGGTGCPTSISPTGKTFGAEGGTGSITVAADGGCNWTASTSESWITITSTSSETGDGTVEYNVSVNATGSERTGDIIIGSLVHKVTQSAESSGTVLFDSQSCSISGDNISIVAKVKNTGTASASGLEVMVLAVEENFQCTGQVTGYVLGQVTVPAVSAGGTVDVNQTVALRSKLSGSYYIVMFLVIGDTYYDCSNEGQRTLGSSEEGGGGCYITILPK